MGKLSHTQEVRAYSSDAKYQFQVHAASAGPTMGRPGGTAAVALYAWTGDEYNERDGGYVMDAADARLLAEQLNAAADRADAARKAR
jgi:hypothetical protein